MLFPCRATNAFPLQCNRCFSTAYRLPYAALPTQGPSLPLLLVALPYHCETLLLFAAAQLFFAYAFLCWTFPLLIFSYRHLATAPLGYAFPLQSCSLPCRLRSKAHQAMPMPFHSDHCCPMQYHCFSWLTMQCPCAAMRSYTFATPLRAFPWRISSVQSKASAKQYLAPAKPYLAAAQLRRTV